MFPGDVFLSQELDKIGWLPLAGQDLGVDLLDRGVQDAVEVEEAVVKILIELVTFPDGMIRVIGGGSSRGRC